MSSEIAADIIHVHGGLRFEREGAETPTDIPANGVLTLNVADGASVTLGGGGASQLVGIEFLDENGDAVMLETQHTDIKFIRVAPGVQITVLHNRTTDLNSDPLPAEQRILTSSGHDFELDVTNSQAFYAYAAAPVSGFRWAFNDRGRAPLVTRVTTSLTSGNPSVIWSRTLAEGEVIGGTVRITSRAEDGGTTYRSHLIADFTASRDVGGSADVTSISVTESGTLPDGAPTLDTSGNDVRVSITATFTGDIESLIRVELDSVTA